MAETRAVFVIFLMGFSG